MAVQITDKIFTDYTRVYLKNDSPYMNIVSDATGHQKDYLQFHRQQICLRSYNL